MTLEKQVCSLELAKKLKELGVKQESLFYHLPVRGIVQWGYYYKEEIPDSVSAFTVAELGEMLPSYEEWTTVSTPDNPPEGDSSGIHIFTSFYNSKWQVEFDVDTYIEKISDLPTFRADTEADARAKMLIYLLENKLITI